MWGRVRIGMGLEARILFQLDIMSITRHSSPGPITPGKPNPHKHIGWIGPSSSSWTKRWDGWT
jgi:hypothetical protein